MTIRLKFLGAAGTVTGSCYLVQHPGGRFIVDCGLFQGTKTLRQLNYGPLPFDPRAIDCVLLTHAHIDHSGLLPKLVGQGFAGPIYATGATGRLLRFVLPDSAAIQESEVERLNRRNAQRGRDIVQPIYSRDDAEIALTQLRAVSYQEWIELGGGVEARFWNAGHILGSASIEVRLATGRSDQRLLRLLFSGDIGPEHKLFHPDPDGPEDLDYIVCEATYGGRTRTPMDAEARRAVLREEVSAALERGGNLLIPAFAVERTQELLADLCVLFDRGDLPKAVLFLDSPLAIRATEAFLALAGDLEDLGSAGNPFRRPNIRFTESVAESRAIDRFSNGAIIMAGSGMCDAGRIRHHLKRHLWRQDSTVLLTGHQAVGTMGHLLLSGKRSVRIHGEEVAVRATIRRIDAYSGHADGEQLAEWVMARRPLGRGLFLVHGDDPAREALRQRLIERGLSADRIFLPQLDNVFDLTRERLPVPRPGPHRLPDAALSRLDWHNDYAQLLLDIREALDRAADEKARAVLLRRLRRALEPGP